MKKLSGMLAGIVLLASCGTGQAVTLGGQNWTFSGVDNLTLTPVVPGGNQPLNIQCIICGDHQPQQQADFGYTNFKNSGNVSNMLTSRPTWREAVTPAPTLLALATTVVPASIPARSWRYFAEVLYWHRRERHQQGADFGEFLSPKSDDAHRACGSH